MAPSLLIDLERRFPGGPTIRARLAPLLPGEVTVLFGPSGAGKSTILRCVAGLEHPDRGSIRCGDTIWFDARTVLSPQRRGVGLLFQDYALFPHLTVAENVGFGVRDRSERGAVVASLLARFGLTGLEDRHPNQISGGQAQRVALARALAPRPSVLLLDEPLSALDVGTREELRRELRLLLRGLDVPSLLVTHDRSEALAIGDRLVLLHEGEVLQEDCSEVVFRAPASGRAARVLGVENVCSARWEDGHAVFGRLTVPASSAPAEAFVACVHAADVDLVAVADGLPRGRIEAVESEGAFVRVMVDVGVSLVARVHRSVAAGLREGDEVGVRIAPEHVHLAPA